MGVTVGDMLKRFRKLNTTKLAEQTIRQTKEGYVQMNKDQLYTGEGADNNKIPAYRSKAYANLKAQLNTLPGLGIPDYYLTGKMYSKMQLKITANSVKVISTVDYYNDLIARGGDPFGLNDDSKQQYYKLYFRPIFMQKLADTLGVKLV